MSRFPAWMWMGWLLAFACVVLMIVESAARRPVFPSQRRGCLWLCILEPDAFTCVQHCPTARARAPPGRR